ncbi:MAG: M23 family metallopeptidase [Endomicrobium sp.]|jgi:murein DD-endopeptidase MepM/ murein hydrolase activator NlpD|nr:M23 family metallopeptidase [Endomicrobium sp.]
MKLLQKKIYIISLITVLLYTLIIYRSQFINFFYHIFGDRLKIERIVIKQGDTLISTIKNTSLSYENYIRIIKELKNAMNVDKCMPYDYYDIIYDSKTKKLKYFNYYQNGFSYYLEIKINNNKLKIKKTNSIATPYSQSQILISKNSPLNILFFFKHIFSPKSNYLKDKKHINNFKIVNVKKTKKQLSKNVVSHNKKKKTQNCTHYKNDKLLKNRFLRAPLHFKLISSPFTKNRFHPILKRIRPHLGTDYVAKTGTPVMTIDDGIILKAQYNNGGFGKLIIIKHSDNYETYYGHLSRYEKGIKKGIEVKRRQIIGYVGSTGLATGPHLDFRIKHNGEFLNFIEMCNEN